MSNSPAELFRELHRGPRILVMPNAWDVASARLFEEAGVRAIATTSSGISVSHGYPDGQNIPADEMIAEVARIARAVRVPVTADLESGYGNPGETARKAIEAGAVGMNFEDGEGGSLIAVEHQQESIRAIRAAAPDLFVNARVDVYLRQLGEPSSRFGETVRRAIAYVDAGADGIFVPGVVYGPTIADLVRAIPAPLNILAAPGAPPIARLEELGVRRVTFGSVLSRVAWSAARAAAREILEQGTYSRLAESSLSFGEMQELLSRH
jgi:2-methylisocitrate lyase-like PEP mutase family enzyme